MATISFKRTAAFVAAFGIALAPATAGIALAQAQVTNLTASTIDESAPGSIEINKILGANTGTEATGEEMNVEGTRLEGVTYEIKKVNVDLTTNEGWAAANGYTPATAPIDSTFTARTQATDTNGKATFGTLPIGMYLVTETAVPADSGLVPGAPFLVYVPMTTADGTAWNYNVKVYPKNTAQTATKTVKDENQDVGEDITYTITGDVPANLTADSVPMAKYQVVDSLDAANVYVDAASDIVVRATNADGTNITLASDDYTVDLGIYTADAVPEGTKQTVTVTLNESGLAKLVDYTKVETDFNATVKAIGATDAKAVNKATIIVNDGQGGGDVSRDTNEVTTYWGKVEINKTDEAGTAKLAGAKFQIYQDATCTDVKTVMEGAPLSIGGQTEFVTDAGGQVIIDGLHVTDVVDNNAEATQTGYCLVETAAPAGYVQLDKPIPFTLANETVQADANKIGYVANVKNYTDENFLPNTGGMGVGLLIAAGAGIIGAGAYAARRNSQSNA